MLPSIVVIESVVSSSSAREKNWSFLTSTICSICSCGSTVSPVTLTSEILYFSPSVTFAVMNMSCLDGLIAIWVDSTLKST